MENLVKGMLLDAVLNPAIIGAVCVVIFVLVLGMLKKKSKEKADKVAVIALRAFQWAEKFIPDNVENKSLKKIDEALKVFNIEYTKAFGEQAPDLDIDTAKDLWTIFSASLKGVKVFN